MSFFDLQPIGLSVASLGTRATDDKRLDRLVVELADSQPQAIHVAEENGSPPAEKTGHLAGMTTSACWPTSDYPTPWRFSGRIGG